MDGCYAYDSSSNCDACFRHCYISGGSGAYESLNGAGCYDNGGQDTSGLGRHCCNADQGCPNNPYTSRGSKESNRQDCIARSGAGFLLRSWADSGGCCPGTSGHNLGVLCCEDAMMADRVPGLVERFDIEPFPDFSAK